MPQRCDKCRMPLVRNQGTICSLCKRESNPQENEPVTKQYTAFELGVALLSLSKADRQLPVIVGGGDSGPDRNLVIEVCQNGDEAYVWIGDPDA